MLHLSRCETWDSLPYKEHEPCWQIFRPQSRTVVRCLWVYAGRHGVLFLSTPYQPDASLVALHAFGLRTNEHIECNQRPCSRQGRSKRAKLTSEGWKEENATVEKREKRHVLLAKQTHLLTNAVRPRANVH